VSFVELGRILLRWRRVVSAGIVLGVVAAAAGFLLTPATYVQSESYLLLYPVAGDNGPGNPFLELGNGVGMAAVVLTTKMSDGSTAEAITADVPGLTYSVAMDYASPAPIVVVTAEHRDPDVVATGLDRLGLELEQQLAGLQAATGAPESTWVTVDQLTSDPTAEAPAGGRLRNAVGAAGVVVFLSLLVVALLERRRFRSLRDEPLASRSLPPVPVAGAPAGRPASDLLGSAADSNPVDADGEAKGRALTSSLDG
jgi:hypothetical protein